MSIDLEIMIDGVSDLHLENEIRQKAREACKTTGHSGQWSVVLLPSSDTRGQWDLGVRGPFGRHFASFTEHVDRLPDLVAEQLRVCAISR